VFKVDISRLSKFEILAGEVTQMEKVDGVDGFTVSLINLTFLDLMFEALSKFLDMLC